MRWRLVALLKLILEEEFSQNRERGAEAEATPEAFAAHDQGLQLGRQLGFSGRLHGSRQEQRGPCLGAAVKLDL